MRDTLDGSLPDTAQITRATSTSDGRGGRTQVWVTVATVACRVAPFLRPSQELLNADRVSGVTRWWLTFPQGTDLTAADRVLVGARTFEVAEMLSARSFQVSSRVIGVEIL